MQPGYNMSSPLTQLEKFTYTFFNTEKFTSTYFNSPLTQLEKFTSTYFNTLLNQMPANTNSSQTGSTTEIAKVTF